MVEEGDVVEVDYVGRVMDTGEIFDLTSEEMAEEEGYDTEQFDLGPVKVLLGAGHVIPGLEQKLLDMQEGEKETVEIPASEAFGERTGEEIETFPRREFEEYDVEPRRGIVVEVDGQRGKIISASSGRVRVDFNHPLAGKDLEYEVEVLKVLEEPLERAEAVMEYYGMDEMNVELGFEDGELEVELPEEFDNPELRERLDEELSMLRGVETVELA